MDTVIIEEETGQIYISEVDGSLIAYYVEAGHVRPQKKATCSEVSDRAREKFVDHWTRVAVHNKLAFSNYTDV